MTLFSIVARARGQIGKTTIAAATRMTGTKYYDACQEQRTPFLVNRNNGKTANN